PVPRFSLHFPSLSATYTLSLHDALPICHDPSLTATVELADGRELTALQIQRLLLEALTAVADHEDAETIEVLRRWQEILDLLAEDRKSTRLNSSHVSISYAVFYSKIKK